MKKSPFISCVLPLACLFLVGCAGGKKTEEGQAKQEIAINLPGNLSTLDTTQTTDKITFTVIQHVFEGLYRFDENTKPIPGLAENVDISQDGKEYTFHLRDNLKWSNGEAITAADFLYTWKRLVDPATQGPNAYLLDNVENSQEIREGHADVDTIGLEAPDEQTFVVQLEQAQPAFLSLVSIGWLAPQNQKIVEEISGKYGENSQGMAFTGPFVLKDWQKGATQWTLAKNPHYYDKKAVKLKTIKGNSSVEEKELLEDFETDKIALTKISGQTVDEFKGKEVLRTEKDVSNHYLGFNENHELLQNRHLRRAIALALDKVELTKRVLNDGSIPLNGLVPAQLAENEVLEVDFRSYSGEYNLHDLAQAQVEWRQAQEELGSNLDLELLAADDETGEKVAQFIKEELEENLAGITINVTNQSRVEVNRLRAEGNYQLALAAWIAASNDLDTYFNLYRTGSAYNYGGYRNSEYDRLVETARTIDANDINNAFEDYRQAEKILLEDDVAQVPLYQSASNYLINSNLENVVIHLYGDYFNLRDAYLK